MLRGMWDLPGPGLEPVFPALAGRFLTTVPPGKSHQASLEVGNLRGRAGIPVESQYRTTVNVHVVLDSL